MSKLRFFCLLMLICCISGLAWADETTISTYYPVPAGVYNTLRLYPEDIAALGSPCSTEGEMFYHATDKQVYVCNGTVWQTLAGYWALSGNNLYPINTTYNVGIGTTAPAAGYKLEVAGKLKATNIKTAVATVTGCGSNDWCSYDNIFTLPGVSLNSAVCTSTINTNSPSFPMVTCQIKSIVSSSGNTIISVRLSRNPNGSLAGSALKGPINVYVIAFEP